MELQPPPPVANALIASLSAEACLRLASQLQPVFLKRGDTLYEVAGPIPCVHFPTTALVSAFVDMPNGASAEVALVGNDGVVGVTTLMCGARLPFRTVIDTSGYAYRAPVIIVRNELTQGGSLQQVMMRYLHARMVLVSGSVVCNGHHSVEQRLCRALLMRLDRVGDSSLFVTQDMLAKILGVRRPAITKSAANLRRAGAIEYRRGRVIVVDLTRLQDLACDCYGAIREQIASLSCG